MVSNIDSSTICNLTAKTTTTVNRESIDKYLSNQVTTTETFNTLGETISSSEKTSLVSQLKETTSGFSACNSCGALFVGKTPPAICSMCGGKTTDKNSETSKVNSKSDTEKNDTSTAETSEVNGLSEILPSSIKL